MCILDLNKYWSWFIKLPSSKLEKKTVSVYENHSKALLCRANTANVKELRDITLFLIVEISQSSDRHSSILPRLKTTTNPQTSRVGNHPSSAQIQTIPAGQGEVESQGETAGRKQARHRPEEDQRVSIVHAKAAEDVRERTCQRSESVYGGEPSQGSQQDSSGVSWDGGTKEVQ